MLPVDMDEVMGELSCESGDLRASWQKQRIQEFSDSLDQDTPDADQSEHRRRDLKTSSISPCNMCECAWWMFKIFGAHVNLDDYKLLHWEPHAHHTVAKLGVVSH